MASEHEHPRPVSLDYATPSTPKVKKPWGLGHRVLLGCGLTIVFLFLTIIVFNEQFYDGELFVVPMWHLATLLNPHPEIGDVILANSLFWGFAISFTIGRQWRKPFKNSAQDGQNISDMRNANCVSIDQPSNVPTNDDFKHD